MLFNLIVNDIEVGIKSSISVFAGNTKLCQEIPSALDKSSLQEDLDKTGERAATWGIYMADEVQYCKMYMLYTWETKIHMQHIHRGGFPGRSSDGK